MRAMQGLSTGHWGDQLLCASNSLLFYHVHSPSTCTETEEDSVVLLHSIANSVVAEKVSVDCKVLLLLELDASTLQSTPTFSATTE